MRATLVHSPGAGYDACPRRDLLDALTRAGYDPVYCTPDDDLDDMLRDPGDVVAVAGGDGTTGRAARRLVGSDVPIGLLPQGTANNVSTALGLAGEPADLIATWPDADRRVFDVGMARGPWGEEPFIESLGFGLFAEMLPVLSHSKKEHDLAFADAAGEIEHDLRFLLDRLRDFPPRSYRVTVDGRDVSGDYLLFEAMNIGRVGPSLQLAPHADPGDGRLHIVAIREDERAALTEHLEALIDSQGSKAPPSDFTTSPGRHVQIEWDGAPLHLDSHVWADDRCTLPKCRVPASPARGTVDVRVEPGALTFLVDGASGAGQDR